MDQLHKRDKSIWKHAETYWEIQYEGNFRHSARRTGYSEQHVRRKFNEWAPKAERSVEAEIIFDSDVNRLLCKITDDSRFELLAGIAFIKNYPQIIKHILAAATRGVDVKLIFRPESLNSQLAGSLYDAGIEFRTLSTIHSKSVLADWKALISSANLNFSSSQRNDEDGTYHRDMRQVRKLRAKFLERWSRAQPR